MRVPKLCHHKGRELGFVTLDGKPQYFKGKWPRGRKAAPPDIRQQYERRLARWLAEREVRPGVPVGSNPSLDRLWLAYLENRKTKHRKHGQPTSEVRLIIAAVRVAARLYGDRPAAEFGPLELAAVRGEFVKLKWSRYHVNRQVKRIQRMFKWGVSQRLVPGTVYQDLLTLEPLSPGEGGHETPGIRPVAWQHVEAVLPDLKPALRAMVQVHRLLGCRAQDVVIMRKQDIDRAADPDGTLWRWTPTDAETGRPTSKTEHRLRPGEDPLRYWVGPQAQALLQPFIDAAGPAGFLFVTKFGGPYSTASYRHELQRKSKKRGTPLFNVLQIRHTRLSEIRRQNWGGRSGAEASQVVARHKNLKITEGYAEQDDALAREVMRRMG